MDFRWSSVTSSNGRGLLGRRPGRVGGGVKKPSPSLGRFEEEEAFREWCACSGVVGRGTLPLLLDLCRTSPWVCWRSRPSSVWHTSSEATAACRGTCRLRRARSSARRRSISSNVRRISSGGTLIASCRGCRASNVRRISSDGNLMGPFWGWMASGTVGRDVPCVPWARFCVRRPRSFSDGNPFHAAIRTARITTPRTALH